MDTKIKILIASVLKPVNDVRAYQKIGRSLAQTNKYDVNIIGFNSKMMNNAENISFHPIFNFKRDTLARLTASWKYYKIFLKVKPQLIIVSSPELLPVNYFVRIIFGTQILYDVQENYRLNIKYSKVYPVLAKPVISTLIKIIEWLSRYFVAGYLLAEEAYIHQLPFINYKPFQLLLNKVINIKHQPTHRTLNFPTGSALSFVYSGTIGREYGTLDAIHFCKDLHKFNENISLTIIGYSADLKYLNKITKSIASTDFIKLIGGDIPVPHEFIIDEIKRADIAIMPYEVNENIGSRIPTKFYEYIALNKPMIIPDHPLWLNMLQKYPAALEINFENYKADEFEHNLSMVSFYQVPPGDEIYWESEKKNLLHFIKEYV